MVEAILDKRLLKEGEEDHQVTDKHSVRAEQPRKAALDQSESFNQ